MSAAAEWTGVEPLPQGQTILLEASAGTGKTWQIEGLLVRLVVEHEVAIDRILVITFTNAATAELRDRIRKRLIGARDALAGVHRPDRDPALARLWDDEALRGPGQARLAAALSSFDLAPISTIHGFSQRMLDQLAFESGQEPGLELLADPAPIVQQLVDDAVALVYASADEGQLRVLQDMGWTRGTLARLAKAMNKAVAPALEPSPPSTGDGRERHDPRAPVVAWAAATAELLGWLGSADGRAAVAAVQDELARKKGNRLKGMRKEVPTKRLDALKEWLAGPALLSARGSGPIATAVKNLSLPALDACWTDGPADARQFAGCPLFERVSALMETQDRLWPQALVAFAAGARAHVEGELLRAGQLTYSTMLSRLAERIAAQGGAGGSLATAIRSRYDVALVDEFQDTDGAQWPVMRAVFAHPDRRLLIIGDPKQAIYAFRGADVHVYLEAATVANTRATMRTNWRSDAAYVDAMNHVWSEGSQAFDLGEIDYVRVGSAPRDQVVRVRGLPAQGERPRRPLELRWIDGETLSSDSRLVSSKAVGEEAAARLAALEAARLLEGDTSLFIARDGRPGPEWSRLRPGDIAVLVRTNAQAERVRKHLERLRIPSVSAGRGSVFTSPALQWLCTWLDAVADPGRDRPARALATTPLFGWTALELATALAALDAPSLQERTLAEAAAAQRWDRWIQTIQAWATLWPRQGFVRVFGTALDRFEVIARLLGGHQGERHATDLRHLIELCHAEERRTRLGPLGLATWLRAARKAAGDGSDETAALRLESDAHAVQLATIHKSKGLEYPVVLLPFGWADFQPSHGGPVEWHAPVDGGTQLRLNLEQSDSTSRLAAVRAAALEARQEQTRVLYVALTRARHHCVAWLGPLGKEAADTGAYALGRVLARPRDASGAPEVGGQIPVFEAGTSKRPDHMAETEATIHGRFDHLAETSRGTVGWSREPVIADRAPLALESADPGPLRARAWTAERGLVTAWQVSSYTAMVAGRTHDAAEPQRLDAVPPQPQEAEDAAQASEIAGAQVELVEPVEPVEPVQGLDAPIATHGLHGGPEVGTWVHAVLEHLDFQRCSGRDGSDLLTLVAAQGVRSGVRDAAQHQLLVDALPGMLDTPLAGGQTGLAPDFSLRGLAQADRLDELAFDLRLGAGNRWRQQPDGGGRINNEAATVALRSRVGEVAWGGDDWLRAVLARADGEDDRPILPRIAGILTGFVDLTFRVALPGDHGEVRHRYFVSDYKTNRIAPPLQRGDSRVGHYTQPWMAWEMAHHGYHLQALLYTVALHRMLRQRVPGYAYDTHIGGHLYLFLRGMTGPGTPTDRGLALGVYHDRWPASVVLGLDAALAGEATTTVQAIVDGAPGAGGGTS